ncbi:MAG: hypothetical protein LBD49_00595 [Oscillospiraceae bacterium]|jgi:hypothetical protein|nr:hypothetical protein [Oscillospiraceae bacterium]
MTEALRNWVYGIVGAAVVSAVTLTITPESKAKRVAAVVCGFVMLTALIKPIKSFDYGSFSRSLARLREDAGEFSAPALRANENLTRAIIEEGCAAYISDKGKLLGISGLEVSVTAKLAPDGQWYPESAALRAEAGEDKRAAIAYEIETGLGVPPEKLSWEDRGGG